MVIWSSIYVDWPTRKKHYWRTRSGATWLTKCFEELSWAGVLSGETKYIEGAKNIVLTIIRERVIDSGTPSSSRHNAITELW